MCFQTDHLTWSQSTWVWPNSRPHTCHTCDPNPIVRLDDVSDDITHSINWFPDIINDIIVDVINDIIADIIILTLGLTHSPCWRHYDVTDDISLRPNSLTRGWSVDSCIWPAVKPSWSAFWKALTFYFFSYIFRIFDPFPIPFFCYFYFFSFPIWLSTNISCFHENYRKIKKEDNHK